MPNANSDPAELEKFAALANRWWDPHSEFKPLHDINPLRLNHIDDVVSLRGKRVLDVGCGGGILSEAMASRGADVTGIDLVDKALTVAKLHLLESGLTVTYRKEGVELTASTELEAFDVVTCMEMLEHVPDPQQTVRACATAVKPGGWVFFSTLNRNPKSYLFAVIGAEYILKLLPKGTHDYAKFIRPSELMHFCRGAGLEPVELMGMTYNPFSKRYALGNDTSVNYTLSARKPA